MQDKCGSVKVGRKTSKSMWWNNEVKGAMERKRDWVEGYYIQMIIVYERVRKGGENESLRVDRGVTLVCHVFLA